MNDTAPSSPSIPPPSPKPSSTPRKTVLLGSVGILFLTILVYAISRPVEKFGPAAPATGQQQGGLPHNHPVVPDSVAQSDAFKGRAQRIELIKALLEEESTHDVKLYLELGNLLLAHGDETGQVDMYVEGGLAYQMYLAENPADPDARTSLAYALYKSGQVDESVAELRRVQDENPRHQSSSFNLALVYMHLNRRDSVIHFLRHTADIDSTTHPGQAAIMALKEHDSIHSDGNGSVAD